MSIRENTKFYGLRKTHEYVRLLTDEFGAAAHLNQDNAYLLESIPFYSSTESGDHISILSFINAPLPHSLLEALISHPGVFPDYLVIRSRQEQDLLLGAPVGRVRQQSARPLL